MELCAAKSVTYRVYDFFLEVLPRKNKLLLMINLDFAECNDPSGRATDATAWAFIINASERGGVLVNFDNPLQIDEAINLIRQGYESAAE